jgi:hypothetical protein
MLAGQVIEVQVAPPQLVPVEVSESILMPWPETLESVPRRNLSTTVPPFAAAGRLTVVVTNPPLLPVQALRPAIGEPKLTEITPL